MATQFARSLSSPMPVPFLLRPVRETPSGPSFAAAFKTAVEAERGAAPQRNPRQRIALFLCELGKAYGCRRELPLSRGALASAFGISLVRVKRTLALLCLSGVISVDSSSITVLDWRKLSGAARFDPTSLGLDAEDEDELVAHDEEEQGRDHLLTASGDPACFV